MLLLRKLILLLLIVLVTNSCDAQVNYFDNNPKWRQTKECVFSYPCLQHSDFTYFINGDTIIGLQSYKRLYSHCWYYEWWMSTPPSVGCSASYITDSYQIAIRQDSLKMFVNDGISEYLLYDFDLSVGDTLPFSYNNSCTAIVASIDSILIGSTYRKVFNLTGDAWTTKLIEGIGTDRGLIESMCPVLECSFTLNCFALYASVYYPDTTTTCVFNLTANEIIQQKGIRVYPNPFHDQIIIENPDLQIETIGVFNLSGEQIPFTTEKGENFTTLKLPDFTKGIYFIKIAMQNKVAIQQIIKTE